MGGGGPEGGAQLHLLLQDAGEAAYTLADPLGCGVAEGQPHRAGTETVGEESRTGYVGDAGGHGARQSRSEEHTSELQSHVNLVCRLLLEKKNKKKNGR